MFPWQRKELQKNAGTDIILSLANGDVNCNSIFRIYSTGGTYNPVTDEPVYQRVERGKVLFSYKPGSLRVDQLGALVRGGLWASL